jgi:hypothetical protein
MRALCVITFLCISIIAADICKYKDMERYKNKKDGFISFWRIPSKCREIDIYQGLKDKSELELLCKSLQSFTSLKGLHLVRNEISENSIDYLTNAISKGWLYFMEELTLGGNMIHDEGVIKLMKALKKHERLKHLNIEANGLTEASLQAVYDTIQSIPTLMTINMKGNLYSQEGHAFLQNIEATFSASRSNFQLIYTHAREMHHSGLHNSNKGSHQNAHAAVHRRKQVLSIAHTYQQQQVLSIAHTYQQQQDSRSPDSKDIRDSKPTSHDISDSDVWYDSFENLHLAGCNIDENSQMIETLRAHAVRSVSALQDVNIDDAPHLGLSRVELSRIIQCGKVYICMLETLSGEHLDDWEMRSRMNAPPPRHDPRDIVTHAGGNAYLSIDALVSKCQSSSRISTRSDRRARRQKKKTLGRKEHLFNDRANSEL